MTTKIISPGTGIKVPLNFTLENPEVPIFDNPYPQPEPTYGSDADVRELTIQLVSGLKIDLRGYVEVIFVTESMFNMKIHGYIFLKDNVGALEKFEIRGGEKIGMKVYKPETEDILIWREDFIVNKIGKHEVNPMTGYSNYQLAFTSSSFIRSAKKAIFKSYKNIPLISAVRDLYTQISPNDLMFEDPQITLTNPYICTGISPHRAIDALAQRSSKGSKFFVFFERFVPVTGKYTDGKAFAGSHYFGSVESLINPTTPRAVPIITFGPKLNANLETGATIRASDFIRETNFNQIESLILGLNKTSFTYLDLKNRTTTRSKISYSDSNFFTDVTDDLYDTPFIDTNNPFNLKEENEYGNRKVTTLNSFGNKEKKDWLPYNIFGMLTKNFYKVSVLVQGATNSISAGDVVELKVTSFFEKMLDPSTNPPLDQFHSGKYYVTGVTHVIKQDQYQKTVELSRGSSPKTFSTSQDIITRINEVNPNIAKLFIR